MKRSPYFFNFCLVYADVMGLTILMATLFPTLMGNLGFLKSNKNLSHLVLIGRDFHPLILSDNLNGHGTD
jgi:hypothetical protein